jgi:hypothetical protein
VTDPDFTANPLGGQLDDGTRIKGDPTEFCRTHSSTLCARWAKRKTFVEDLSASTALPERKFDDLVHIEPPEELFIPTPEGFAAFQEWLEPVIHKLRVSNVNPDASGYYQIRVGAGKGAACAWCTRGAALCGPEPCDDRKRWVDTNNLLQQQRAAISQAITGNRKPASEILAPVHPLARG